MHLHSKLLAGTSVVQHIKDHKNVRKVEIVNGHKKSKCREVFGVPMFLPTIRYQAGTDIHISICEKRSALSNLLPPVNEELRNKERTTRECKCRRYTALL